MNSGASRGQRSRRTSFPRYANHEAVAILAASQNNFSRNLYMKLAEKSGNVFCSPFTIMAALGMTYAGTGGNTKLEMRSVMHLSEDDELIHNAFKDVVTDMKTDAADYELRTSNMAFVSDLLPVLSKYSKTLKEKYLSTAKTVNFDEHEKVRQEINAAVEGETNSRIKGLIPEDGLNSLTRLVLVNAVYFKGSWAKKFSKRDTRNETFWISSSENIKVPMMYMKDTFRLSHHEKLGATVLAMDYKGSRLSMIIVLPDQRDGLTEVEAKLAETNLSDIDKELLEDEVEVTIPKYEMEETLQLVSTLQEMGIKDIFRDGSADLSGMSPQKGLYVSKVFHKAFLKVNEEGSEASAATAVVVRLRSAPVRRLRFIANHPFFFLIKDNRSGLILFSGRLVRP